MIKPLRALTPDDLDRLACPVCHEALRLVSPLNIECTGCGCEYPVIDSLPVLIDP